MSLIYDLENPKWSRTSADDHNLTATRPVFSIDGVTSITCLLWDQKNGLNVVLKLPVRTNMKRRYEILQQIMPNTMKTPENIVYKTRCNKSNTLAVLKLRNKCIFVLSI